MRGFDHWKTTNPADNELGPDPADDDAGPPRKIIAVYWPKPIPMRQFDWEAWFDGEEEFGPIGYGRTEAEAIADLKEQVEE